MYSYMTFYNTAVIMYSYTDHAKLQNITKFDTVLTLFATFARFVRCFRRLGAFGVISQVVLLQLIAPVQQR